jgi:hypothetical protein
LAITAQAWLSISSHAAYKKPRIALQRRKEEKRGRRPAGRREGSLLGDEIASNTLNPSTNFHSSNILSAHTTPIHPRPKHTYALIDWRRNKKAMELLPVVPNGENDG